MRIKHHAPAALAALVGLTMLAGACGGGNSTTNSNKAASGPVVEGGNPVFAADQEPDCADWLGTCAGSAWGVYTMQAQTVPRAFDVNGQGRSVPSSLLAGEPDLKTDPQQQVTYHINPKVVWSDGQPIT